MSDTQQGGRDKGKKGKEASGMTVQISIRMPKSLAAHIDEVAQKVDEDRTSLIVGTLEDAFLAFVDKVVRQKQAKLSAWKTPPSKT